MMSDNYTESWSLNSLKLVTPMFKVVSSVPERPIAGP